MSLAFLKQASHSFGDELRRLVSTHVNDVFLICRGHSLCRRKETRRCRTGTPFANIQSVDNLLIVPQDPQKTQIVSSDASSIGKFNDMTQS